VAIYPKDITTYRAGIKTSWKPFKTIRFICTKSKKKHLLPKSRYKYTIENPFDGLVIELMKRVLGITVTSWKPVV